MDWKNYRKLIVAAVGLTIMLVQRYLGLDLSAWEQAIFEIFLAALIAAGVYQVPNRKGAA